MSHFPETPEGVAFGLVLLILGEVDPALSRTARDPQEVLRIYGECIAQVIGTAPDTDRQQWPWERRPH